ncbi:HAD family hydrolase [Sphingomonas mucosissima]|uniref:6-phosphogluconate phosphatase n=1 Tax=Sphingomonas mucosissima TaxID=370959 RepID=A0A245ZE00_9SPHN|nr:HAD family hydrolase [Sphingomonas mucosissima]OWK27972.1 6-phosphogluconate phosphatase [Sphingomonas mucosissima]
MPPASLIIFDCDGVLIDSEILVCRLTSEELTRVGYPIGVDDVISRFAGRAEPSMIAEIERDWGRPVPPSYYKQIRWRIARSYPTELRAIPEVAETLAQVESPICVASSSYPEKLLAGLRITGLLNLFGDNVVSATRVAHGKPAPDVFIYAAGWMRTPVDECIVVEDSVPGVRAACAAGMRVLGFVGGRHCRPGHGAALLAAGAESVLERMGDLRSVVPEVFGERCFTPERGASIGNPSAVS